MQAVRGVAGKPEGVVGGQVLLNPVSERGRSVPEFDASYAEFLYRRRPNGGIRAVLPVSARTSMRHRDSREKHELSQHALQSSSGS